MAQWVKNPPAMQTWVPSLGLEDPPEEGMATHSSILAWKIHRQRSLVGYSPQGYKEPDAAEMTERARTHCKDKAFSTQSPNLVSLMQFMCVHAQLLQACLTLCDPVDGHLPDSSVQSILQTAILKCYTLFQGIFLTQGWNPSLLHCRQILYP